MSPLSDDQCEFPTSRGDARSRAVLCKSTEDDSGGKQRQATDSDGPIYKPSRRNKPAAMGKRHATISASV